MANYPLSILLIICLFAIIELISSFYIQIYYSCDVHRHALSFIELSGLLGFLSTLIYFILTELKKTHQCIYLFLSNIYFVGIICVTLYWLIRLSMESRQFLDHYQLANCQTVAFYFIFGSLIGNFLILIVIIAGILCWHFSDKYQKENLYAHTMVTGLT
jgi:hypothetical protein